MPEKKSTPEKKSWTRAVFEGAGFAVLYALPFAASFLSESRGAAYHSLHPLTTIYRALLIVLLAAWLLASSGFYLGAWIPERWRRVIGLLPFSLLIWLVCRAVASALASVHGTQLAFRGATIAWIASVLFGIVLLRLRPALLDRCFAAEHVAYRVAAFGMLVLLPRVGYHAWRSEAKEFQGFERASLPAVSASEPRIVWVLMDELSYDQTFEHRAPDVALPNFDRLAQSSLVFSDVQPVGDSTEKVIPGLLVGKQVAEIHLADEGEPAYRTPAEHAWQHFNQHETIFAQAQALGWTTGLAGWFNPYCRLMPDVLDRCFWQFSEPVSGDLSRYLSSTQSTSQNVLAMMPLRHALSTWLHRPFSRGSPHRHDYMAVMAQSEALVRDSRIRFVFIHLNVPHPAGIYNRAQQAMSDKGTYLDNLVLADRSLEALRDTIQSTPAAANTTLIVCSDHSWRTYLWKSGGVWSREAEKATQGGRFDPRPVLIVHLPGSDQGSVNSAPVPLLFIHTMLESMLRGQVHSYADIDRLDERAIAPAERHAP